MKKYFKTVFLTKFTTFIEYIYKAKFRMQGVSN